MRIRTEPRLLERAIERSTDEDEIRDVLDTGSAVLRKRGRLGKAKVYPFGQERLGKHYQQQRVEVFYTVDYRTEHMY